MVNMVVMVMEKDVVGVKVNRHGTMKAEANIVVMVNMSMDIKNMESVVMVNIVTDKKDRENAVMVNIVMDKRTG